jgi:hypothetical protein
MYAIANTEYVYFRSQVKNPEYLAFFLRSKSGYPLPISLEHCHVFRVFIAKKGIFKGGAVIYLFFLPEMGGKAAAELESTI